MILVDSSIWIDHFRQREARLVSLLENEAVAIHPFIIGELACGNLKNRKEILSLLSSLTMNPVAHHAEVMQFIATTKLFGKGLGWIDIHLLASCLLNQTKIWTLDKRLGAAAVRLKISYTIM